MSDFGTTVTAQKYMAKALKLFFQKSFLRDVTNRDFETPGDDNPKSTRSIKREHQKFHITSLYSNGWSNYSGSDLSFSDVTEVVSTLTIDVIKSLADMVKSLASFKSSVDDPESSVIDDASGKLKKLLDQKVLEYYADAASGNWIGTSYSTGTVAIAATTGVVTGTGTVFTASMVGKPFKAEGHTKWYRVKSRASNTEIVIENDSDDETSAYDGGVISGGSSYEIQANTAVAITQNNIAQYLAQLSEMLDEGEVPAEHRYVILPAVAKKCLLKASEFNVDIEKVHDETVKKGKVAKAYGFDIYIAPTSWFQGDNTSGIYCLAGHKSFLTAGYGFIEPISINENPENNFGAKIKGLFGAGFKVADERRKAGATMLATFNLT